MQTRAHITGGPLAVSVVAPVLEGERFLPESLESILGQTFPPLEVIVMDDGSTDSTAQIVASYGDSVRYVRQPATAGVAHLFERHWYGRPKPGGDD